MWPFGHKHNWTEFVCTLKDLGYPRLGMRFQNSYTYKAIVPYNTQPYKHGECEYPTNAKVIYSKCSICNKVQISIYDGSECAISFEHNYIRVIVEQFKKKKDEEETDRLLNYGNVDYQKLKDTEKSLQEYKEKLDEVQEKLKETLEQLKKSQENDAIWEVIPLKVKQDLFKKYEKKIKSE
jgi:hypothetical protein